MRTGQHARAEVPEKIKQDTLVSLEMIEAWKNIRKAKCQHCGGSSVFVEPVYSGDKLSAEMLWQFHCFSCGWRDDVRYEAELLERELQRQEVRALTQLDRGDFKGSTVARVKHAEQVVDAADAERDEDHEDADAVGSEAL